MTIHFNKPGHGTGKTHRTVAGWVQEWLRSSDTNLDLLDFQADIVDKLFRTGVVEAQNEEGTFVSTALDSDLIEGTCQEVRPSTELVRREP